MLQTQKQLQGHVKKLSEAVIDVFLLSPAAKRKADVVCWKLSELEEGTEKLQLSDATIRSARAYFDAALRN